MIIRTEDLKSLCSKILFAIDSSDLSILSDTLQLKMENQYLHMYVTNKEYFVDTKINTYEEDKFNATINAGLFLKLISNASSESIELNIKDNSLEVICDGKYNIPLVMDNDTMLELPILTINNITKSFNIDSSILNSILTYNSKELNKGIVTNQVQRMYYIDEHGAITFSNGACVNSFELEKPISILLPQKIVKLFKLFKDGGVNFNVGYDPIDNNLTQMKVSFEDDQTRIVAILALGDSLIKSVPVEAIRKRAFDNYDYSIVINRNYLLSAINRLSIFSTLDKDTIPYVFDFSNDYLTISNNNKTNTENIYYSNEVSNLKDIYTCKLYLFDLKAALEAYKDEYVTIKFGNNQAITLVHSNIYNIIPECSD